MSLAPRFALACPLLALLAPGCASDGLGRVPVEVVSLYDQMSPDGTMEIEIDRHGIIREIEADVPIASLPEAVKQAALATLEGATITGAELEIQEIGKMWEVKLDHKGKAWELIIDGKGVVREEEVELDKSDAPDAVMAAAGTTLPDATFKSVELIKRGKGLSELIYHVKKERDGVSYKIVITPDGDVVHVVREQKSEIEIPLAS